MPFNNQGKPHGTGKHPHKYTYTYEDIARITGLTLGTVRQYASKGKKHKFNPRSFRDVIRFLYNWIEAENRHKGTIVLTPKHQDYHLVPDYHKIPLDK